MAVAAGTRFNSYEIIAPLGARRHGRSLARARHPA